MNNTQLKQLIELLSPEDQAWLKLNAPAGSLQRLHDLSEVNNRESISPDASGLLQAVKNAGESELAFSDHVRALIESLVSAEVEAGGSFNE